MLRGLVQRQASENVGRRAVLRALGSAPALFALGGCAALSDTVARLDSSELAATPTLLGATTRKPVNGGRSKPWFGPERARLSVARARLAPPDRGRFSRASVGLSDWAVVEVKPLPGAGELLIPGPQARDVLIFVHGYNHTFESAALDAARLSEGIKFRGESMVFAWPSKAKLLDYGYDRESAMWSRDALEHVLLGLTASPWMGRAHIVAHSIGTMVTMEALRQLYSRHGARVGERIGAIVFAAPDIDMDVFASSVERIGPLAGQITVVTSTKDRALAVSGWMAGGITRVGAAEQEQLRRLGLQVIDASEQGWGIFNHDLYMSNDRIREVIRRAVEGRADRV
jgi:esterase/lipase superfamily enzyme